MNQKVSVICARYLKGELDLESAAGAIASEPEWGVQFAGGTDVSAEDGERLQALFARVLWLTLNASPDVKRPDRLEDFWEGANAYERFMGRWSRELARTFVMWLEIPRDRHWLEVGCGTGALTTRILELGHPASVVATDASEAFVTHAREVIRDDRVQFVTAGANNLPRRATAYDVVASALVLNFLPDPVAALREMKSLVAVEGVVAACVWDYAGEMQFLRRFWDAAVELDPVALQYDEGVRFPICSQSALAAAFRDAGFVKFVIDPIDIETRFRDFDDFWMPFVGGPGPAPGYLASIAAPARERLARRLAETLPRNEDGSIPLEARAWAVRAERDSAGKPPTPGEQA